MILLIIDTQKAITNKNLYNFKQFKKNILLLISESRKNNVEVIFTRHDDGPGTELSKGTEGFEIYEPFKPKPEEKVFDKTANSPFKDTGLLEYLFAKKETTIIIAGLQTEYCIDAAIKCGFEHGFTIIVPQNTNTSFDNFFMTGKQSYKYYNDFIWKNRYAQCFSIEETVEKIKSSKNSQ